MPVLGFIFLQSGCFPSQKTSGGGKFWETYYQNQIEPGSKIVDAGPTFTVEQNAAGQFLWREYFYDTRQKINESVVDNPENLRKIGKHKSWTDGGALTTEGQFRNGKHEGVWKFYSSETGKPSRMGVYKNGDATGEWTEYHPEGGKKYVCNYVLGKKEGKEIEYDISGKVVGEKIWKDGKLESPTKSENPQENGIYDYTEVPPSFPGGEAALMKFISSNIKYPNMAKEYNLQGRVIVSFVVGKDGAVQDLKIIRGVCFAMQNEVIRIMKLMPNWQPGTQNGNPVKVRYTLPVMFRLE